jgi:hypothetical protein
VKKHIDPIVYPAGKDEIAAKADLSCAGNARRLGVGAKRSQKGTIAR